MNIAMSQAIAPFIQRQIFHSEEEAMQEILRDYILRQITKLKREMQHFRRKYGMTFQQFGAYLHERSLLLQNEQLLPEQQQRLGQAVMQEEDG